MNFSVDSNELAALLKRLSAVVSSKPMIPMHGHIRVKSEASCKVSFYAYNTQMSAQAELASRNDGPFEFGLNASILADVVSVLPKGTTVVFTLGKSDVKVVAGKSAFKLNIISEDVFTPLKNYDGMAFIDLDVREFITRLKRVSFCRNNKSEREVFSSVCVNSEHFVSTDGFRLSYIPNPLLKIPGDLVISGETADRLQKLFDKVTGPGKFFGTPSEVHFSMGGTTVSCRLLSGKFPKYQSILLTGEHVRCLVNKSDMVGALDRTMAVIGASDFKHVELKFGVNELELFSTDSMAGDAKDTIVCECPGLQEPILLSGTYLAEAVKHYTADKIVFELRGAHTPFVMTDGEHINVIQPIKR